MKPGDTCTCKYCNRPTTITVLNIDNAVHLIDIDDLRIKDKSHIRAQYYRFIQEAIKRRYLSHEL